MEQSSTAIINKARKLIKRTKKYMLTNNATNNKHSKSFKNMKIYTCNNTNHTREHKIKINYI